MADNVTPQRRSWNMSRIRSADTKPEMILRSVLHRMGFRFRVHCRGLPGRPDIVLRKYHTIIFVHGCFWHQHSGCIEAVRPKTNKKYWMEKLDGNVKRDGRNIQALRDEGWRVFRFWECEIEKDPIGIAALIAKELRGDTNEPAGYRLPTRTQLLKAAESRTGYNKKR
ncbi:MAG: DNA mismatch endonuclease Vsr [Deltaproteobacteria bacterium]|nr:DNA mismatch endonuclease Vsr [Deltaproteobacteria bacterium]